MKKENKRCLEYTNLNRARGFLQIVLSKEEESFLIKLRAYSKLSLSFFLLFILSACGQSYHLTDGFSLAAGVNLPLSFNAGQSYPLSGTCSPNGATVTLSSPDMMPSPVTTTCVNGSYVSSTLVQFSGSGPNGMSPIITAVVTNADGNSETDTRTGSVVLGNPNAVISSATAGPTNASPIPVTITFSEDMDLSTIALTDFVVGNGTASNLSCAGSPTVCTIDVTPTVDGPVTVDLAANQADDLAGNGNNVAVQFSIVSDTTAPPPGPITASTSPASPTTDPNADLNIDCGIASANGTVVVTTNPANGFTPNYGTTETLDANGQLVLNAIVWSPGTYDILLACSDAAGNGPTSPGTPPSITIDNGNPGAVITSTLTGPTNANPVPVTITFSEDMDLSTIVLADFTVGNGTASNLSCAGSPTVCTIDVAPTADGPVTVDLAANQADDLAGNGNNVAVQFSIVSDTTAPPPGPITASTSPASPTTDPNADLNIDCGIASANGAVVVTTNPANGFTPNYGTTETLDANGQLVLSGIIWSPGTYDILLACSDAAGNGPTSPGTPPSITIDNGNPGAVITSTLTGPTNANPVPVTITFSEDMDLSTIVLADFTVGNGTASNLSCAGSPTVCTIDVTPTVDGPVTVDLAANQADDLAGNGNNVAVQFSIVSDTMAPPPGPITASTSPASPTTDPNADLNIDCGVASANGTVVATTSPANGFTPNYGTTENLDANGQLVLSGIIWSPGTYNVLLACSDAAGNGPTSPGTPPSITIDNGNPGAVITSTLTGPTNANPVPVTITFSEDMDLSTIVLADFTVGNGTASNLSCAGSPTVCTIDVTPTVDGPVTVDLAANQADDLAGNGNNVAVQFSIVSDTMAPPPGPITASTSPASPTTDPNADLNIDCGIASANGAVVVTTNPANGFTPNYGTTETLDANGQLVLNAIVWSPGTYDILLACSDAAGNGPTSPATPPSITIDNGNPSAVITSTLTGPTNANPIPVTITFSEDMDLSTIVLADFVVGNGTASNLSCAGSPTVCTIDVAPAADGPVTVDLAANQADDLAGNGNNVAVQFSIVSDTTAPPPGPITAGTSPASPTSNPNADLNIDCGIASANGTVVVTTNPANGFTPNYGTTETLDANGQLVLNAIVWSPGTYDILLACSDAAGNGPTSPGTPPSISIDNVAPTPVIASTESSPTNASPIPVSITFDEDMDVSTIALTDFVVSNGTASNLSCAGSPTVCTIDVAPAADGTVTVDLAANQADDLAGNGNNVAVQFSIVSDTTAPPPGPITAGTSPASPTTDPNADLNIDCGIASANGTVVVTTNPANGFTPNYGTTENLDANGQLVLNAIVWSPGTYDILLACSDAAGNGPTSPGTPPSISIDTTGPTVAVEQQTGQADPATSLPVFFDVVFNEAIDASTFMNSDITFSGTAPGTPVYTITNPSSDNINFVVEVSGFTGSGTVVISLAAGVVDDLAGNASAASTSADNSVQYNHSSAPIAACTLPAPGPCNFTLTPACSGSPSGTFQSGSGTSADPYIICTAQQFQDMDTNLSAYYQLGMDIDGSVTSSWNSGDGFYPIGYSGGSGSTFTGSLDGDGYKVCDLYMRDNSAGYGNSIFHAFDELSVVTDISFVDVDFVTSSSGSGYNGILARYFNRTNSGAAQPLSSQFNNIFIGGQTTSDYGVAGLFGSVIFNNSVSETLTWGNISIDVDIDDSGSSGGWGYSAGMISYSRAAPGAIDLISDYQNVSICANIDASSYGGYSGGAIGNRSLTSSGTINSWELRNLSVDGTLTDSYTGSSGTSGSMGGVLGRGHVQSLNGRTYHNLRSNMSINSADNYYVGGVIGQLIISNGGASETVNMSSLVNTGNMTVNFDNTSGGSTYESVGGVIGAVSFWGSTAATPSVYLNDSYNSGNITSSRSNYYSGSGYETALGGLVGTVADTGTNNTSFGVKNSFSVGDIAHTETGTGTYYNLHLGGLVGTARSVDNFSIENSFSTGDLSATGVSGTLNLGVMIGEETALNPISLVNSHYYHATAIDCVGSDPLNTSCTSQASEPYFYDIDNAPMTSWDFSASGPWDPANDDIDYPTLK